MLACLPLTVLQSNEIGELQMRKTVIIICTVLSLGIILESLNAGHALVMFLLAGVIPGTDIALSANRMLELFTFLIGFTLSRVTFNLIRLIPIRPRTTVVAPRASRVHA